MCHWPQAPHFHHMSQAANAITVMWVIRDGITTCVNMTKQNMTLLAEVASHEKPVAPASVCLWRPQEHPEELLHRNLFLHSIDGFYTKWGSIRTVWQHYSHNTIYFLIPLDFKSALIHTKWSKTQVHSISTPKSLKLEVILSIPEEVQSFAFLKGSCSKTNWKYTESTLKYEHGTILSKTSFSTLFRKIFEIFISKHCHKEKAHKLWRQSIDYSPASEHLSYLQSFSSLGRAHLLKLPTWPSCLKL